MKSNRLKEITTLENYKGNTGNFDIALENGAILSEQEFISLVKDLKEKTCFDLYRNGKKVDYFFMGSDSSPINESPYNPYFEVVMKLDKFSDFLYSSFPKRREVSLGDGLYSSDDDLGSSFMVLDFDNFSDQDEINHDVYLKFRSKADGLSYQYLDGE